MPVRLAAGVAYGVVFAIVVILVERTFGDGAKWAAILLGIAFFGFFARVLFKQ